MESDLRSPYPRSSSQAEAWLAGVRAALTAVTSEGAVKVAGGDDVPTRTRLLLAAAHARVTLEESVHRDGQANEKHMVARYVRLEPTPVDEQ